MIRNLVIGGIAIIGGYLWYKYETEAIEEVEYTIESEKIPKEFDNFNIVQISDLHSKSFGRNNEKLIKKIDNARPDAILITGDLIEGSNNKYNIALELVDYLSSKYKVYHIIGNHEQKSLNKSHKEEYLKYYNELVSKNIVNLNNESISIKKGEESINIHGLIVPLENYPYFFKKYDNPVEEINKELLVSKFGVLDKNKFNILMSHTPFYFEEYAKWGVDLVLAGHVHGGIIRIPFIGGLLSPNREFFPKYDCGMYEQLKSKMILTKGLGGSKVVLRINCRPEIIKIKLKSKKWKKN